MRPHVSAKPLFAPTLGCGSTVVAAFVATVAMTLLPIGNTSAQEVRSVPARAATVTGPVTVTADSRPFLASAGGLPPIDLAARGYVEEEFIVSGTANVYDWAASGGVTVKSPNAPYTTRILVRRPSSAARFSGAVVVEPMFPARRWDWSMMWGYSHDYFIDHGDAWVGVTLPASVSGLRRFNPERYAALSFKNPAPDTPCTTGRGNASTDVEDGLRWDMLTQVGALLKSNSRALNGYRVEAAYLTTQGGDLTTYMNAIHQSARLDTGKPVYDGYVAKAPFTAARISQCGAAPGPDDPRHIVKNIGVPVIAVAAQGEVLSTYASRREDSDDPADRYRLYEVAGAGHIDKFAYVGFPPVADQAAAGNLLGTADWPFASRCEPDIPMMATPIMTVAFNTAFSNLDLWARKGMAPPRAPRLEIKDPGTPQAAFVADQFGHAQGGLRTPYIEVPVARYATNSNGPGNCREMGHVTRLDASQLTMLYGTEKGYASKLKESVDRLVKARWLTRGDADRVMADVGRWAAN